MAKVIFYEKPGCINNTQQKKILRDAGHDLEVRDLLKQSWTAEKLRPFFGDLLVVDWFNHTAPAVKSGSVNPESVTEQEAIRLMIEMPLLIRRPLMQVSEECRAGFDIQEVNDWIGLQNFKKDIDLETCPRIEKG